MSLLKPSTKALTQSSKVAVRVDKRGFLSLQYMIVTEERHVCFVEYLVSEFVHVYPQHMIINGVSGLVCTR